MTSDRMPQEPTSLVAPARAGPRNYIYLAIVASPLAAAAAGVRAFLGQFIAVASWGAGALKLGTCVGAGTGAAMFVAWVLIFVVRAKPPAMDWTAYRQKIAGFIADMEKHGMSANEAFPTTAQLVVGLGFQVPPPLFWSILARSLLFAATVFSIFWTAGAAYWWERPNTSKWFMAILVAVPLLLCLLEAVYGPRVRWQEIAKYQLPSWNQYSPPGTNRG